MRLSFVIPTRNQARFLRQCIDSCLAQGVQDSEVLVVDGASTDETREVLSSYGDRIAWVSEPDRGQSDAINKGIRRARGQFIAWINSDDYYASADAVRRLLDEVDRDPELDVVYGDGMRVDVEGAALGRYVSRPMADLREVLLQPSSFVQQPSLLFRRSLFLEVGGLDETLHYAMDYDLWVRMFERARHTRYVPVEISCARYHADAKSIDGMGRQIVETALIKLRARRRFPLGLDGDLRTALGVAKLGIYWLAVRTGLRRAT